VKCFRCGTTLGDDQRFCGRCGALVSGDPHLLGLRGRIPVQAPREFLDSLER